jgi:hypothetical protein
LSCKTPSSTGAPTVFGVVSVVTVVCRSINYCRSIQLIGIKLDGSTRFRSIVFPVIPFPAAIVSAIGLIVVAPTVTVAVGRTAIAWVQLLTDLHTIVCSSCAFAGTLTIPVVTSILFWYWCVTVFGVALSLPLGFAVSNHYRAVPVSN